MADRTIFRLKDIVEAIDMIDALLAQTEFATLESDRVKRAAFERFLEILSEASRHISDDLKSQETEIPWQRVAGIGNHIRHAYHKVDFQILWNIWSDGDLAALGGAVGRMIARLEGDDQD